MYLKSKKWWSVEDRPLRLLLRGTAIVLAFFLSMHLLENYLDMGGRQGLYETYHDSIRGEALLHGIRPEQEDISRRMPLFPLLSVLLFHHSPDWALSFAVLLAGLIPLVLVFTLGRTLHSFACGLAAALLAFPLLSQGVSEAGIYQVLFLLVANLVAWRARTPSAWRSVMAGLAMGFSLLVRSPFFLFPLFLILYERISGTVPPKSRWNSWTLLLVVPMMVLLPWIYMNWMLQGRLIPLEESRADCNIVTGALGLVMTIEGDYRNLMGMSPQDSALSWAMREVLRHPLRYLLACGARVWYAVSLHPLLFLLGVLGVWLYRRREDCRQMLFLAAYFIGIHCLMSVQASYFEPVWPIFAVLTVSVFAQWVLPLRKHPPASVPMGLVWACFAPILVLGLFTLGLVGTYSWRVSTSEDRLTEALKSHPDDPWLWSERGHRRLLEGDAWGAVRDYGKAFSLEPSRIRGLDYAWALMVRGGPTRDYIGRVPLIENPRLEESLLRTVSSLRRGKEEEAARFFAAVRKSRFGNIFARSPNAPIDAEITAKLRSSDTNLVSYCASNILAPWPARERLTILAGLKKLVRSDAKMPREPDERALDFEISLMMADTALKAGNRETAKQALQFAERVALDPDSTNRVAALQRELAAPAKGTGGKEPIPRSLTNAEALKLDAEQGRRMVSLQMVLGEYRASIKVLTRLASENPKDAGLRVDLAAVELKAGDRVPGLRSLASAEVLKPDAEQRRRMAGLYLDLKEPQRALRILMRLASENPKDAGLRVELAAAELRAGDRVPAMRSLSSAEALKPDAEQKHRVAVIYIDLNEYRKAVKILVRLSEERPRDGRLLIDLGAAAQGAGDRDLALRTLARAERLNLDPDQRCRMTLLYQQLGEHRKALEILDGLVREHPDNARYLNDRGVVKAFLGRKEEAIRNLQAALRLDPAFVAASLTLGGLYASQGRTAEAREVYEKALAHAPTDDEQPIYRLVQKEKAKLDSIGR